MDLIKMCGQPLKITLVKFTYPGQPPKIPFVPLFAPGLCLCFAPDFSFECYSL